jgi:plastocyanin
MLSKWKGLILLIGTVSLVGLAVAACSRSSAGTREHMSGMNMPSMPAANQNTQARKPNQIVIQDFSFAPATLTVKAGTKVTWINRDSDPHTVDENDKRFKSGAMDTDAEYSFTFNSPGTFKYFCALHPKMTGQVVVQ